MKCTKSNNGQACIDILPRIRYKLRVRATLQSHEFSMLNAPCFFQHGLIIMPDMSKLAETEDCFPEDIVVLNLSEKTVRLHNEETISSLGDTAKSGIDHSNSSHLEDGTSAI